LLTLIISAVESIIRYILYDIDNVKNKLKCNSCIKNDCSGGDPERGFNKRFRRLLANK